MKAFAKLGWIGVFCCVQACSKSDDKAAEAATFQGAAYAILDGSDLTATAAEISGTGKIIFDTPLGGVKEGAHFAFTVALEDGGEARLISFAKDDLADGVEWVVSRAGAVLTGRLLHDDQETDISEALKGHDAAQPLSLHMDVHNDETPAHVLMWPGDETAFGEESALYNSEANGAAPGNGAGAYWGIAVKKASFTAASTSAPKFEEE